jgi:hypothetical protein
MATLSVDPQLPGNEYIITSLILFNNECRLLVKSQMSAALVLKTIADDKSLELFATVALETIDSKNLKSRSKLTRKQYYSRLSRMTKAGLVRRKNGKYVLTTFGKIVYESKITIESALSNYWKLKAIDSLETSNEVPKEEQQKLIETLLDNDEIRGILGRGNHQESALKDNDMQISLRSHSHTR